MLLLWGRLLASVLMVVSLTSVGISPAEATACQDGEITPAAGGTYSICVTGMWVHIERLLCVDYPQHPYCAATAPASTAPPPPPPAEPSPAIPPSMPYLPGLPYVPPPSAYVPNVGMPSGCTWVNGYTKKNGTRVRGHMRC